MADDLDPTGRAALLPKGTYIHTYSTVHLEFPLGGQNRSTTLPWRSHREITGAFRKVGTSAFLASCQVEFGLSIVVTDIELAKIGVVRWGAASFSNRAIQIPLKLLPFKDSLLSSHLHDLPLCAGHVFGELVEHSDMIRCGNSVQSHRITLFI